MRKFEVVDTQFLEYVKEKEIVCLPKRATKYSAGYDFYSTTEMIIKPQETMTIWTNIKVVMNNDEFLMLCSTSGISKRGLRLVNSVGIIDKDYYGNISNDGNIGFRYKNESDADYIINFGDKIGQGIFMNYLLADSEESVESIRIGGFGSTDNNKK